MLSLFLVSVLPKDPIIISTTGTDKVRVVGELARSMLHAGTSPSVLTLDSVPPNLSQFLSTKDPSRIKLKNLTQGPHRPDPGGRKNHYPTPNNSALQKII